MVSRMKRAVLYRLFSLALAFPAGAAMLVCAGCDAHDKGQTVTAAAAEEPSASVKAPTAQTTDMPDAKPFVTTGPLVAEQQADIAAERDGRVVNIAVQIGDRVHLGQLLASLDDRVLRAAVESQKARIASAQAHVREWEAEQKGAEADLRRADAMRDAKIISEEQWEHVKYRVDETIQEVALHRNEQAAAEADLNSAAIQLEQSRIVAPFAGVVGRSTIRPAQEVKKGDVLFWITAVAPLHVLFTVPETEMAAFSAGKPIELTTADYPDLHQAGRILRVSPVIDPASGSVQVIGAVVGPSPLLKPGMTMQVRLAK
jgi:RND family efflux transporter MFP subunit